MADGRSSGPIPGREPSERRIGDETPNHHRLGEGRNSKRHGRVCGTLLLPSLKTHKLQEREVAGGGGDGLHDASIIQRLAMISLRQFISGV